MNSSDEIVEEVRATREAYAAQFDFDLTAMFEDLKKKEQEHPERLGPVATRLAQSPCFRRAVSSS